MLVDPRSAEQQIIRSMGIDDMETSGCLYRSHSCVEVDIVDSEDALLLKSEL